MPHDLAVPCAGRKRVPASAICMLLLNVNVISHMSSMIKCQECTLDEACSVRQLLGSCWFHS